MAVLFVRIGSVPTDARDRSQSGQAVTGPTFGFLDALTALDPSRCLIVIPCSASKLNGGRPGVPTPATPDDLAVTRRDVLRRPDSLANEVLVMPAWERYDGHLYRAAGPVLGDLAADNRLVILSGGYGVLGGRDLIGGYKRLMKSSDWPRGLLEQVLANRAIQSGLDVVAFAGTATGYAKTLRQATWQLPEGRTALFVSRRDVRGVSVVSTSLGRALRAFIEGRTTYPPGVVVESLDR